MDTINMEAGSLERDPINRKPRLALMGEFSAGKSTLSNILLGCAPLPVKITATRLPPVWISYGEEKAFRVDLDGNEHQLDVEDIPNIQLEETKLIKLFLESDVLELCDLIDMPGISDPNMPSSVWESAFSEVDSVVWCTHATQAWRQSEAAAWELVRSKTNGNNLIIISQFDKLLTERDRSRVLNRVLHETIGLFKGVFPVSLIDAMNAGEDVEKWERSGAAKFTEALIEMLLCSPEIEITTTTPATQIAPATAAPAEDTAATSALEKNHCETEPDAVIIPRRVRPVRKGPSQPRSTSPSVDPSARAIDLSEVMQEVAKSD